MEQAKTLITVFDKALDELLEDGVLGDVNLTEKQRRVIRAAVEVFAEKGFSAATTQEIAKRAKVAEGTLFKFYKSKKDMLLTIGIPVVKRFLFTLTDKDFLKLFEQDVPEFPIFLKM